MKAHFFHSPEVGTDIEYTYDPLHLKSVSYLGAIHRYLTYHLCGRPQLEELPFHEGERRSTYDLLGQLLECEGEHYAYDSMGNCTLYRGVSYTYNSLSQLEAVPVDSLHNPTDVPHNRLNQRQDREYDLDGYCISSNRVYDSLGRLIQAGNVT
ncbi:MAG: hypothetical protein JSR80_03340, partial [Verrucomicrobia bacterium]|nr:hypothetical protein [Verrucomicrobiota bacterium]